MFAFGGGGIISENKKGKMLKNKDSVSSSPNKFSIVLAVKRYYLLSEVRIIGINAGGRIAQYSNV